jgi:hypothetical protein
MRLMEAVARYGSVRAFWESIYDGRVELSFLDGDKSAPFPREVAAVLLPMSDADLERCSHFAAGWVDVPYGRQYLGLILRRFTEPPAVPLAASDSDPDLDPATPTREEAIRKLLRAGQRPDHDGGWKAFAREVQNLCRMSEPLPHRSGFTWWQIQRVTKKILTESGW